MPRKGDDLESITAQTAMEHHANADMVLDDTSVVRVLFRHPSEQDDLQRDNVRGSGMQLYFRYPRALVDDANAIGLTVKQHVVIRSVDYFIDHMLPAGNGLTLLVFGESQTSNPSSNTTWR